MNEHLPVKRQRQPMKGAVSGAFPGALIGWIFGLFDLINPLVASVVLVFYGLIIGAVLGLVMHALQRGRRDFDAVTMTVPSRFEVVADEEVADEAARLIADSPVGPTQQTAPTTG